MTGRKRSTRRKKPSSTVIPSTTSDVIFKGAAGNAYSSHCASEGWRDSFCLLAKTVYALLSITRKWHSYNPVHRNDFPRSTFNWSVCTFRCPLWILHHSSTEHTHEGFEKLLRVILADIIDKVWRYYKHAYFYHIWHGTSWHKHAYSNHTWHGTSWHKHAYSDHIRHGTSWNKHAYFDHTGHGTSCNPPAKTQMSLLPDNLRLPQRHTDIFRPITLKT